jgi:hypothetical protein
MRAPSLRPLLAVLAASIVAPAQPAEVVLTDGPEAAVHVVSGAPARNGFIGVDGDASVRSPTWYFAQWGIPRDLPAGVRTPAGADWQVANPYARVAWLAQPRSYELAQDGDSAALACGVEEDLFLAPTTPGDYPGHAVGLRASRPLSRLDALVASLGLDIVAERIDARCATSPNYAAYTLGLILSDAAVPEPQTLFYQLMFRDSRGTPIDKRWCSGYEDADTPVFCIDDGLATVSGLPPPIVGGGRRAYGLDLLPALLDVIATHHAKRGAPDRVLDDDPSHWRVTGLYHGQIVMGGGVPTSRWDAFSLIERR